MHLFLSRWNSEPRKHESTKERKPTKINEYSFVLFHILRAFAVQLSCFRGSIYFRDFHKFRVFAVKKNNSLIKK